MTLGTREELTNYISNSGATLCDLAATYGCTPEDLIKSLEELDIPLPSMTLDGPFDFIKGLQKGITNICPAQDLIKDPFGGFQFLPKGKNGELIPNKVLMYKAIHGEKFIDSYTGKEVTENDLYAVDGNPDNFLVTNLEAIGSDTTLERFSHPIGPVTETFKFVTRHFIVKLTIGRKYDQLIGGTYNPDYLHQLFCTWVGYPLNLYFKRNAEEETLFKLKTPTAIAWWIWSQLSNYALLKGIKSIKVTSIDVRSMNQFSSNKLAATARSLAPATMQHSALLQDSDVLTALQSIVTTSQAKVIFNLESQKETAASL